MILIRRRQEVASSFAPTSLGRSTTVTLGMMGLSKRATHGEQSGMIGEQDPNHDRKTDRADHAEDLFDKKEKSPNRHEPG
jgi:hypothetical protein